MSSTTQNPVPEFVTAKASFGIAYGWKLDCQDILAFGDTKQECLQNWISAYSAEYPEKQLQTDMFIQ